jgi:RNA polymerase sigma factor (sigma-70 family)
MKPQRRITKAYFDFARLQYAPLIHKLAFRIGIDQTQVEDLKARAVEELLGCMICYDRRCSFMTFVYGRLTHIFKHMRDAEYRARRVQTVPLDFLIDIPDPNYDVDSSMDAQECLRYLNGDERDVITELFFNEKTTREVSRDRGVVPSTISRIKIRAMIKIKQRCE